MAINYLSFLSAQLNSFPAPMGQFNILKNPDFNDPFTGNELTGWQNAGDWDWDARGSAVANRGSFLFQQVSGMVVGAAYTIQIDVSDYTSGSLDLYFTGGYTTASTGATITRAGQFTLTFNAAQDMARFHLFGNANFIGRVESIRIFRS